MKKIILLILISFFSFQSVNASKLNAELIELAKVYRNFMFRNSATDYAFDKLNKINSSELAKTVDFIKETIITNNDLTTNKFLTLPDEETLYHIYIIRRINWNIREEKPKDNDE